MRGNGTSGGTLANDGYSYTADNIDEHSWQVRHDFGFVSVGAPGLTLINRYIQGRDIDVSPADHNGKEWIRESELAYAVQTGTLKDLVLKWRSATVRSDFQGRQDFDEHRLIIVYPLNCFERDGASMTGLLPEPTAPHRVQSAFSKRCF